MLNYKAGERHCEVVSQTTVAELRRKAHGVAAVDKRAVDAFEIIARVQDFEKELVALLAILTHKGGEVLHGRSLNLPEAKEAEHLSYGVEDIVTARHLYGREVACSLRGSRFLCHFRA